MDFIRSLRLGLAYGASLAEYTVGGKPRPFSASFVVTNRCNLRCVYCNFPLLEEPELDLTQVATVFDQLRSLGVVRLGLVGGEPLVRKDIATIVSMARERGFFISMNSNLTLYERFPHVFEDVDLVFTSLDGVDESHRANRGQDSLHGVTEAISDLLRRGKQVVGICVVNEQTLPHANALLDRAESLGFRIHFQPQCFDTDIVRGEPGPEFPNESIRRFWRTLADARRGGRPVASSLGYLTALSNWEDFRVSAVKDETVRCAAGRGFLFVDAAGRAYPCAYTKGKCEPVDLLSKNWRAAFHGETPCTSCSVGPMLEANLLFRRPVSTAVDALRAYASSPEPKHGT